MKTALYFLLFLLLLFDFSHSVAQSLKVHESNQYLINPDGSAFLWIGDTAWELFHKLNREEAEEYLRNRKEKGFTVIQAVVLAENDGLRTPNAYGDLPLNDLDPTKPNEAYFKHVDYIVDLADELGLFIAMLPTWGDKVFSENPGAGPIVFNAKNAEVFGEFLGQRYRDNNIVWILGGDRNIANDEVLNIWINMAQGLKKGDEGNHLISYHPRGASTSSYFLHNEDWLDFNMYQSGHEKHFNEVYRYARHDMLLQPRKPFIDGEPAYEDIPIRFWEFMDFSKPPLQRVPEGVLNAKGLIQDKSYFKDGYFTDYDVRVHAYWNFLSGACGYTYGNNAIWQMFAEGGDPAIPCLYDWRVSMDRPGAEDMKHLHELFSTYPFEKLIPDQSVVYGVNRENENYVCAAISNDQSFVLVYAAKGQRFRVVSKKIQNLETAQWFNPRDGSMTAIPNIENSVNPIFTPPTSGTGNDWLLVLEK
jgi:hypothetical protein